MDSFRIEGGVPLSGAAQIRGSKNASLPVIFASLLGDSPSEIDGVPDLRDTKTAALLLSEFGVPCVRDGRTLRIDPASLSASDTSAPYELVKTMRASVLALGPVLAKTGGAKIYMPGGCAIGARPVDMHIEGLRAMGAKIEVADGYIEASARRLRGCEFAFRKSTVTGTANMLMAACLAKGTTVLSNAAIEPEITDLCKFLRSMGAKISWVGERTVEVRGQKSLSGARHGVPPDRIEAGTLMVAAAATRGNISLSDVPITSCASLISVLKAAGARIKCDEGAEVGELEIASAKRSSAFSLETAPYPGFPTDMQAQLMALACLAKGTSTLRETIFENRFLHAVELQRMGANIRLEGNLALVKGKQRLSGARVMATDLRASACLVIAGLAAHGMTVVDRVYHLDRGYEALDERFRALGGNLRRVSG